MIRNARGAAEVDVCRVDVKSDEQRKHQCGGDEKNCSIRQDIADETHEACRDHPSCRGEALIASKSFGKRRVADEANADGSNRQSEQSTSDPEQRQR